MESKWACSTSHPSGNQVDGLPLVAHTGAGLIDATCTVISRSDFRVFVWLVLAILLVDLDETLGNTRYMYDLNLCKVSWLSVHLALRNFHFKHRLHITILKIS